MPVAPAEIDLATSRTLLPLSLTVEFPTSRTVVPIALTIDWATSRILLNSLYADFQLERTLDIPLGDPTIPNYRPPSRTIPYLHLAKIVDSLYACTVFIPNSHSGTINESVNPKGVINEAVHPGVKITAIGNPTGKVPERTNPPGKVLNE